MVDAVGPKGACEYRPLYHCIVPCTIYLPSHAFSGSLAGLCVAYHTVPLRKLHIAVWWEMRFGFADYNSATCKQPVKSSLAGSVSSLIIIILSKTTTGT